MTSKDYRAIAAALLRASSTITVSEQDTLYAETVNQIAAVLQDDNKLFSKERFKQACFPKITIKK